MTAQRFQTQGKTPDIPGFPSGEEERKEERMVIMESPFSPVSC